MSWFFWRRWRDLNPRTPCGAYRISNPDPSATWVHLQATLFARRTQAVKSKLCGDCVSYYDIFSQLLQEKYLRSEGTQHRMSISYLCG